MGQAPAVSCMGAHPNAFLERDAVLAEKSLLFMLLRRHCPKKLERRGEWSIDPDGRVYATLCLRREIPALALLSMAADAGVPPPCRGEILQFRSLRCWRHIVRIDSEGGLALYAERDWDDGLLRSVAAPFDIRLAEIAGLLAGRYGFTVAIAGINWSGGACRFRLHLVSKPRRKCWASAARHVKEVVRTAIAPDCGPLFLDELLARPRRALVWNMEMRSGVLACKLELPDMDLSEAEALLDLDAGASRPCHLPHPPPSRLSYLGVRFTPGCAPSATYYFNETARKAA